MAVPTSRTRRLESETIPDRTDLITNRPLFEKKLRFVGAHFNPLGSTDFVGTAFQSPQNALLARTRLVASDCVIVFNKTVGQLTLQSELP